jgi:hypothetical protein
MKRLIPIFLVLLLATAGVLAQMTDYDFAVAVSNGEALYASSVPDGTTFDFFDQDSATDAAMYYTPTSDTSNPVNVLIVAIPRNKKPPRFNGFYSTRLNCFAFDGVMYNGARYKGTVCGYYYLEN